MIWDISLHLMDLAQNSITAGATLVEISIRLSSEGMLAITLTDNGSGMDEAMADKALSPFGTTRTTRKVGLGIPLAKQNAELTGGTFHLTSSHQQGTRIDMTFDTRSIDCLPLGDIPQTMVTLIASNPVSPDFILACASPLGESSLDTRVLKQALDGVMLSEPEVISWMKDALTEETQPLFGGILQ